MQRKQSVNKTAKSGKRSSSARGTVKRSATTRKPATSSKHSEIWRGIRLRRPLHKRLAMHPLSMFTLLCTGVLLYGLTTNSFASQTIKGVVEAPPLLAPATINTPTDGTTVTTLPITVTGTCPDDSYVNLNVNGAFGGTALCDVNNTYSITASLYPGSNTLTVQDYNITDLPGPHTDPIAVIYNAPVTTSGGTGSSSTSNGATGTSSGTTSVPATPAKSVPPLLLTSSFNFKTFTAGTEYSWQLDLEGGVPPYAVHSDWGDGSSSDLTNKTGAAFTVTHRYAKAGYFPVVITATDTNHQTKVMQLAALIKDANGNEPFLTTPTSKTPPAASSTPKHTEGGSLFRSALPYLWPAYAILVLMVVSFWLGEVREYQHTRSRHRHA